MATHAAAAVAQHCPRIAGAGSLSARRRVSPGAVGVARHPQLQIQQVRNSGTLRAPETPRHQPLRAVAEEGSSTSSELDDVEDGRPLAVAIAQEADMLKGKDIVVLHVAPLASWTSYMVLVTVFSRPQMQAMLFKIGRMAQEKFGKELAYTKQTSQGKDWECMDFGEVVVQVMTEESREYYDLESFYAQAEELEVKFGLEAMQGGGGAGWQKKL